MPTTPTVQDALARSAGDIANKNFERAEVDLRRLLSEHPTNVRAMYLLSCLLAATGRLEQGIATMQQALPLQSDASLVHTHLGELFRNKRDYFQAMQHARQAVAISRNEPKPFALLGWLHFDLSEFADAVQAFRAALRMAPHVVDLRISLARTLLKLGHDALAEQEFEKALAAEPTNQPAYAAHAGALAELEPHTRAADALRRAAERSTGTAAYWSALGSLQLQRGQMDAARESLEAVLRIEPHSVDALNSLAQLVTEANAAELTSRAERVLQEAKEIDETSRSRLHYVLFKMYDPTRRFDEAFAHLVRANAIRRASVGYDEKTSLGEFDDVIACMSRELIAEKSGRGFQSRVPIFILGMPRSGSTLIEQIIASHSAVAAGGELSVLYDVAVGGYRALGAKAPFPAWLPEATPEQLTTCGKLYVERLASLQPNAERVTDKLPSNVNHLGLIHLALPQAKIILTDRDPLDICFSCFARPFGDGLAYTNDLGELGRYCRAYLKLVEHWTAVLPAGSFLKVRYEDVVADLETESRRMLAFCDLPWDPKVLEFTKLNRAVRTASITQVRQPIYDSSIGRWRNYAAHLAPLRRELGL